MSEIGIDSCIKSKTQGEIINMLRGTGKSLYYRRLPAINTAETSHIGAQAYRTVVGRS